MTEEQTRNPLERMAFLVLARQWSGQMFMNPTAEMPAHWQDFRIGLPREFHAGALILAGIGILGLFVRNYRAALFFLAGILSQLLFMFNYSIWDIYVMYIPVYILLAMLSGIGLGEILSWTERIRRREIRLPLAAVSALTVCAVFWGPVLAPRLSSLRSGRVPFIGDDRYVLQAGGGFDYQTASKVVSALEPDALVLMRFDNLYQYWYAAAIDQSRPDLRFVELYPFHSTPGMPASTVEFIRGNLRVRPVFLAEFAPEVASAGLTLTPVSIQYLTFYRVGE
jgi:hypothetical protein